MCDGNGFYSTPNTTVVPPHQPKQSQIAVSVTRNQHILSRCSIGCRHDGRCRCIITIVPHASHQKADRTIVCQPFNVFHCHWTAFGRQRFYVPCSNCKIEFSVLLFWQSLPPSSPPKLTKQQIEINRHRLYITSINAPIQMCKRL